MRKLLIGLLVFSFPGISAAAEADVYCQTGTSSTGFPIFQPASSTNPCPMTGTVTSSAKPFTPVAGAQYGLTVATATALTVPATATFATVTVEGAPVRYTSDGATTPTSTVGMGPFPIGYALSFNLTALSNLKFIQTSASATIDVEYFK